MEAKQIISSGLLEQYVLGLTSPQENDEIASIISSSPEVKEEMIEISKSLEAYAALYAVPPSPSVKEKLFNQIQQSSIPVVPIENSTLNNTNSNINSNRNNNYTTTGNTNAPVYKMNSILKFAVAACLFLLLGSLLINFTLYNKNKQKNSELASVRQELESQKQVALDLNQEMSVVKNKMAMPVVLNGTPHFSESVAKIFWMKNSGEVYVDPSNLPSIPTDKQYQLWAIVDGKPVSAGMISSDNGNKFKMQKMHSFGKAQAFAITIEKTGGSPTPHMDDMVVIAKI